MNTTTKKIEHDGELIALIIPADYHEPGIQFFTPDDFSQQVAYMSHPKGKVIEPHVHNLNKREVSYTQEVLVIKAGKLKVDFYDNDQNYLESTVLEAGDIILLASGGHGFSVEEDISMVEIKQGPYAGEQDKVRFTPAPH